MMDSNADSKLRVSYVASAVISLVLFVFVVVAIQQFVIGVPEFESLSRVDGVISSARKQGKRRVGAYIVVRENNGEQVKLATTTSFKKLGGDSLVGKSVHARYVNIFVFLGLKKEIWHLELNGAVVKSYQRRYENVKTTYVASIFVILICSPLVVLFARSALRKRRLIDEEARKKP